jgi:hypothetical protein
VAGEITKAQRARTQPIMCVQVVRTPTRGQTAFFNLERDSNPESLGFPSLIDATPGRTLLEPARSLPYAKRGVLYGILVDHVHGCDHSFFEMWLFFFPTFPLRPNRHYLCPH